jgi:hypothetical protein
MFRLNQNKQKTNLNSLKESIFGYFSENLGLFWFISKQSFCFGCFDLVQNKPKRNLNFLFLVSLNKFETQPKQIWLRFVSVWNKIFICLFRGHPRQDNPAMKNSWNILRKRQRKRKKYNSYTYDWNIKSKNMSMETVHLKEIGEEWSN